MVDAINSLQLKVDNLKLYNVKDYGAVGDGVTDDTQAIIDCISDNGGAYFPPGTYIISSTIFLDTNQYIVGSQGMDSIIKAAAGSNANVIKSLNFDAERGTDDHNNDQHNITIAYITIDGNYREHPEINTSIGNIINSTGTGVSLYAGGINMLNVNIINCGDDGLYTEWGSYLNTYIIPDGMESVYHNVVIKCCGRHGWEFQGSHDSIISQCVIATNNRKDDGCHNLYVAKSNFKMVNCHLYSDYGAPKVTTSLYVETAADPLMIVDSDIEGGGSTNMILLSSRNLFVNCRFYASFGANDMYIVNSTAKYNMFVGCMCGDQVTEPGVPQPTWHGAVEFGAADEVLSFFELLLSDTPACIYHSAHAHSIWRLVGYNTKLQISGQYDALPDPLTDPNWDEEDISIVGTFDTQSHYVYNTNAYVASYVASYLASFVRTNEVRYDSVSNAYKYYDGSNWIIPDEYVKYDPNESQFKFYGSGTWYIPTGAVRYNFTHIQAWDGSTWVDILSL